MIKAFRIDKYFGDAGHRAVPEHKTWKDDDNLATVDLYDYGDYDLFYVSAPNEDYVNREALAVQRQVTEGYAVPVIVALHWSDDAQDYLPVEMQDDLDMNGDFEYVKTLGLGMELYVNGDGEYRVMQRKMVRR